VIAQISRAALFHRRQYEIRYFNKDLPIPLREAVRRAIHASPIVPDEMKILVAKP